MKKQKLTKLLSLFLTVALLTGVLLVTSAAAEAVVPLKKSAGSLLEHSDTDAFLSADPGQVMANASGGKAPGVFMLLAVKDSEHQFVVSAFYCADGSNAFIASDSAVDPLIKDGYDDLTLIGLNGEISASYLGTDGFLAYFYAEGLESYTPLKMGSTPVNEVTYLYLDVNDSNALDLYGSEMDLSTCKTENNYVFISDKSVKSNRYFGMPVISTDSKLVGETFIKDGHLAIFRFVGTDFKFPSEYALSAASGGQDGSDKPNGSSGQEGSEKPSSSSGQDGSDKPSSSGGQDGSDKPNGSGGQDGSDKPSSSGEQDGSDKPGIEDIFKDKTTLYLIIGVAAVATFLFWKNKEKKQPQQQDTQGSIALDSGSVKNIDASFDKTENQTAPATDGQDIYGPTVPNLSEALRHSAPLPERETVPVTQWQVRCVKGPLSGKVYPLSGKLIIGRGSQCDVKFPPDAPGVSSMHCQVSVKDDKVYLQDLGSSYGTYYPQNNLLNSRTDYPLHSGEVFTLAQDGASFRLEKIGAVAENDGFTIKDINGKTYRSDASMRLTLGRNPGCQGNFGDDETSVSGRHCVLYREDGKLYLMDLDSTNGTFFSQQERLRPNVPYRIRKGMAFFLTTPKYTFVVVEE